MIANNLIHPPSSSKNAAWEFKNLSYRDGSKKIFDDLSVSFLDGETTCLCGGNGAGKTLLVRCGLGLIDDVKGSVRIYDFKPEEAHRFVGYVPQYKAFQRDFSASVTEFLGAALLGFWPLHLNSVQIEKISSGLQLVDAERLKDRRLQTLSVGELQRVFLARALIINPKLLILDEPFAGMDEQGRFQLLELLRSLKRQHLTIVLITHSKQVSLDIADRMVFLSEGRLLAWDTPERIFASHDAVISSGFVCHDHDHHIAEG